MPFVQRDLIEVLILAVPADVGGLYLSYYAGTASVALGIVAVYLLALPLGRIRASRRRAPVRAETRIA